MANNVKHHTQKFTDIMQDLVDQLRADVSKVDDPRAQALFETSAETIEGLMQAFRDYEAGNEAAWRED